MQLFTLLNIIDCAFKTNAYYVSDRVIKKSDFVTH